MNFIQMINEGEKYIKRVDQSDSARETNNYVITELGNEEFERLMYKYGSTTEYVNLPFYSALLFADEYKRDDFKKLIDIQIEQTKNKIFISVDMDKRLSYGSFIFV